MAVLPKLILTFTFLQHIYHCDADKWYWNVDDCDDNADNVDYDNGDGDNDNDDNDDLWVILRDRWAPIQSEFSNVYSRCVPVFCWNIFMTLKLMMTMIIMMMMMLLTILIWRDRWAPIQLEDDAPHAAPFVKCTQISMISYRNVLSGQPW